MRDPLHRYTNIDKAGIFHVKSPKYLAALLLKKTKENIQIMELEISAAKVKPDWSIQNFD